jgi:uncharacterized RDD family membrane protein YckC
VLEFEHGSVPSRALAQLIDLFIRLGMAYIVLLVLLLVLQPLGTTIVVIGVVLSIFFIIFGYPVLFETRWNGQTLGKRLFGLRVVTVEGAPVRFHHAAIRAVVAIVDFFIPPIGVTATFCSLLNRRNQRLGDIFAGTIVLREHTGAAFPVPVSFAPMMGYETYARSLDVGGITPDQYAVIRSFLVRVNTLTPEARGQIGLRLANSVATGMHHTPPPGVTPEAFLVSVAAAYQLRQGGPPIPLPAWISQWGVHRAS